MCLCMWFTFFYPHSYYARGVACARSVVSVDWCYQAQPSGLTTMLCARAASVIAALCVACAAKLPTHLLLCIAAACATGQVNTLTQ